MKARAGERGAADQQDALTHPFRPQADGNLKQRHGGAVRAADQSDLSQRQTVLLRQDRQQHVEHVAQAIMRDVGGAADPEHSAGFCGARLARRSWACPSTITRSKGPGPRQRPGLASLAAKNHAAQTVAHLFHRHHQTEDQQDNHGCRFVLEQIHGDLELHSDSAGADEP